MSRHLAFRVVPCLASRLELEAERARLRAIEKAARARWEHIEASQAREAAEFIERELHRRAERAA